MLQRWHSLKSPSHSEPPNSGTGLSHRLDLVWSPPPHSTVHAVHSSHSLNPPSTKSQIDKVLINLKLGIFYKSLQDHYYQNLLTNTFFTNITIFLTHFFCSIRLAVGLSGFTPSCFIFTFLICKTWSKLSLRKRL